MKFTRRNLLATTAKLLGTSAAIASLPGCTVFSASTTNGVTILNVNTAQVAAYAQAAENFTTLILGLPGLPISPAESGIISAAGALITSDIAAFNTATNGQAVLTFNSGSAPAAVTSLLTDAESILTDAKQAIGTTTNPTVTTYLNALATIVSLFQAMIGTPTTAAAAMNGAAPMSEAQALSVLKVRQ